MRRRFVLLAMPLMAISFLTNCSKESINCSLDIALINCEINGESSYSRIYTQGETIEPIKVTPISNHYLFEESIPKAFQEFWSKSEDESGSYVLSNLVMNGTYKFTIASFEGYTATIDKVNTENLVFTTNDGKPFDETTMAYKGRKFRFKVKADNPDPGAGYMVPSSLNITIGGSELLDGYEIFHNEDLTEADVVIDGTKVVDDITIAGKAGREGQYRYEVKANYGLEPIDPGFCNVNNDLIINFQPSEKEESNDTYKYPKAENIYIQFDNCPVGDRKQWVSPDEKLINIKDYCEYDDTSGKLTIKSRYIATNINIVARAYDYPLLDNLTWEQIRKVSFSGTAEYVFYLGEEKNVKINNVNHTVHIIGFHQDYANLYDKEHTAIGITFEFKNVISDENGFSLATYWQDTASTASSNHDYKNSSVRKALMGEGNAELNWFRYYKDEEEKSKQFITEDDTSYYRKSVYEMLPEDLTSVLATPSKYINIYNGQKEPEPGWEEQIVEDKLFLLSPFEMGLGSHIYDEEDTEVYAYYSGASDDERIKHQVCGETDARTTPLTGVAGSYPIPVPAKESYAGYDGNDQEETARERGTYAWLRSPYADPNPSTDARYVYSVDRLGRLGMYLYYPPYITAINLAPAFCI